jgi:hypothetical protein
MEISEGIADISLALIDGTIARKRPDLKIWESGGKATKRVLPWDGKNNNESLFRPGVAIDGSDIGESSYRLGRSKLPDRAWCDRGRQTK